MQSYPIKSPQSNLMVDLDRKLNSVTKGIKQNFLKLAYQRNPHSLYDELLIAMVVLLFLSVLFTLFLGCYFHYNIFQNAFGVAKLSVVGSFCLLFIMELAKVFFGLHLARSFFSMLWWKSLYSFLFMIGIGVIVVVAFGWSINITTKAVAELNHNAKTTKIYQAQDFSPPPSIVEIDARLAELDKAKEAGAKSTWKGRTTQKGISVIQSNTDLQSKLLDQRALIMKQAMDRDSALHANRMAAVATTSLVISDYGGKAEYATILLIILVVLFEFINYEKNKGVVVPLKKG